MTVAHKRSSSIACSSTKEMQAVACGRDQRPSLHGARIFLRTFNEIRRIGHLWCFDRTPEIVLGCSLTAGFNLGDRDLPCALRFLYEIVII
jgi:hypothetical protein